MAKENKTHSLIYFAKASGDYILSTPKLWAHANSHHFKNGKVPTVNGIAKYLKENYNFKVVITEKTVMLYNFEINIPEKNGKAFI